MFRLTGLALQLFLSLMWLKISAVDITKNAEQMARLAMAATQLDRMALLPSSEDWIFDFTAETYFYNWKPGGVTKYTPRSAQGLQTEADSSSMNAATFPATKGNGMTLAMVNLGPCAMLPPHFHPRAANWVVATMGNTTTFMQAENGANTITTWLTAGKATIFPAGSMHTMFNNECENAQLVSALNSEDAGTTNVGQVFTNGMPCDWVNAAFGSKLCTEETADRMVPVGTGANWGSDECLRRCNILPRDATDARHGR